MKRFVSFTLMLVLLFGLCACDVKESALTWQEQYDLGIRYLEEGNYEEAIIAFTAAIEIDSKQAPAYVGRGDAYVLSGETEDNLTAAKLDYEKAIELDKTSAKAYLGLADVYIRHRDYDKALEILKTGDENTGKASVIEQKLEEIKAHNTESKDLTQVDITKGYWEMNGYTLGYTRVYRFESDGTFMMQMGIDTMPAQGRYEYTGHTITLFYRDEVDDILNYDVEKQIFISSQKTTVVDQGTWYPDGFLSGPETLRFLEEAPIGFFEDEIIPSTSDEDLELDQGTGIKDFVVANDSTISAYLKETVKQYMRNNEDLPFRENAENMVEAYKLEDFHYYIKDKQIILHFEANELTSGTNSSVTIPTGLFEGEVTPSNLLQLLISSESNGFWTWYDDKFSTSRGTNLLVGDFYFGQDMTSTMSYGYYCSEYLGDATGTYILTGDVLTIDLVDNESGESYHYEFRIEPIGGKIAFTQISEI